MEIRVCNRASKFLLAFLYGVRAQGQKLSNEQEANEIADRVESTYKSLTEQLQKIQQTLQSSLDSLFGKVRDYLNSLERPELNYEGIQADFSKLFEDPQAGLEALGDRVCNFDRDTLVAVISSREDISEADANRIIDKIEATRDGVLQRAQQVQLEVKKRIKKIQKQTRQQAIETQKVAAGAAWWLFGTAITSLAASAVAGIMAVKGFGIL